MKKYPEFTLNEKYPEFTLNRKYPVYFVEIRELFSFKFKEMASPSVKDLKSSRPSSILI